MMSGSVSCGRYMTGLTYSRSLRRPRWCTRTIGAPSKIPPTLPSFARNSAMVFAFQSLMSNSCRSRSWGMRWGQTGYQVLGEGTHNVADADDCDGQPDSLRTQGCTCEP